MAVQLDDVIGKRVVVDEAGIDAAGRRLVEVLCECGDTQIVRAQQLPYTRSCRKCAGLPEACKRKTPARRVAVGDRIGQRVIIAVLPRSVRGHRMVLIRCSCGREDERIVMSGLFRTKACARCAQYMRWARAA